MSNDVNLDFIELSPAVRAAIKQRLDTKAMLSLLGICNGLIVDGELKDVEIHYLNTWLTENIDLARKWPGSAIYLKIKEVLADGVITKSERQELITLLQHITGNYFADTGAATPESPALPVDDDPSVFFKGMSFCFTGTFMFGTRPAVERTTLRLGGTAVDNVSKKLNYLVIGGLITPSWAFESYGRKIEKAAEYRDSHGAPIIIISERHWTDAVYDASRISRS